MFKLLLAAALLSLGSLTAPGTPAQAEGPAPDRQTVRYEVDFMTDMIDHHHMAIMMSRMCLEKAVHPALEETCADIIAAQQAEIELMQEWLVDWYGVNHEPTVTVGDMKSMNRLHRLDGEDFEVAFMELMVRHHWTAVTTAERCAGAAHHEELNVMCRGIITAQLSEIEQMRSWLGSWYERCGGRPAASA